MIEQEDEPQAKARLAKIVPGAGGAGVLRGSISFDQKGVPFHTPSRIELMHELLHVQPNVGESRVGLGLNDRLSAVWKDAEEFWTVEAGSFTEADFGHDPRSDAAQRTFKQHYEYLPDWK
ncbi:hypothetical protein SAMN05421837_119101 [Amycolatopsis pretoriensis]|uniref:Uncharacterized protein n=1 Tax=Amycolatopsis pretoriensis TaxID=218821 RepID=A0A1H5RL77_9PSEU|nr:hypothetical protein [Amycolatopsis pretoriensis]SEF38267.1 hypothetical protein SAMN05421837_119101 [Amycolatopsis pretoriensis]